MAPRHSSSVPSFEPPSPELLGTSLSGLAAPPPEQHSLAAGAGFAAAQVQGSSRGSAQQQSPVAAAGPLEAELEELRAELAREAMERSRLQAQLQPMLLNLTETEAQASRLGLELQQMQAQRDELTRQIGERQESCAKLQMFSRKEQESCKSLDGGLTVASRLREELEATGEQLEAALEASEQEARELQLRMERHQHQSATAKVCDPLLEQLKQQLEATARSARHRKEQHQHQLATAKDSLSHLETTSPGSSVDGAGALVAASSDADEAYLEEEVVEPSAARWSPMAAPPDLLSIDLTCVPELAAEAVTTPVWGDAEELELPELEPGVQLPEVRAEQLQSPARRRGTSPFSPPVQRQQPFQEDRPSASPLRRYLAYGDEAKPTTLSVSLRDLSELKALKKPPLPLRTLMEICCMLFEIPPEKHLSERGSKRFTYDYWEPARRFLLSDSFFLSKLRALTPEQVPSAHRSRIRRYFRDPEFSASRVSTCSKAALELHSWIRYLVETESSSAAAPS